MKTVCAYIMENEQRRGRGILAELPPKQRPALSPDTVRDIAQQLAEDLGQSPQYWQRKIGGSQ
jgi:hypothetical protein